MQIAQLLEHTLDLLSTETEIDLDRQCIARAVIDHVQLTDTAYPRSNVSLMKSY